MRGPRTSIPVRVVLAVGVLAVIALLAVEMSGSAPRTAGSNHVGVPVFAATLPHGGTVCQPVAPPPEAMAATRILIGTYGRPVPALGLRFLTGSGMVVAEGQLGAGAHEGLVTIPVRRTGPLSDAARACLHAGGPHKLVIGGQLGPQGTATVDGKPVQAAIELLYLRRGSESWWQLLPTLTTRFGLGKSPLLGGWTLPVMALLLAGVWFGTVRLLARELR